MKHPLVFIFVGVAIIFFLCYMQSFYLNKFTNVLLDQVGIIKEDYDTLNFTKFTSDSKKLEEEWDNMKNKLCIFTHHDNIHKIEEGLAKITKISQENFYRRQVSTNFALIKVYIKDIVDDNKFIIENIL